MHLNSLTEHLIIRFARLFWMKTRFIVEGSGSTVGGVEYSQLHYDVNARMTLQMGHATYGRPYRYSASRPSRPWEFAVRPLWNAKTVQQSTRILKKRSWWQAYLSSREWAELKELLTNLIWDSVRELTSVVNRPWAATLATVFFRCLRPSASRLFTAKPNVCLAGAVCEWGGREWGGLT